MNSEVFLSTSVFKKIPESLWSTEAGVMVKIASPDNSMSVWKEGRALQVQSEEGLPWPFGLHMGSAPTSTSDHVLFVCSRIHLL